MLEEHITLDIMTVIELCFAQQPELWKETKKNSDWFNNMFQFSLLYSLSKERHSLQS